MIPVPEYTLFRNLKNFESEFMTEKVFNKFESNSSETNHTIINHIITSERVCSNIEKIYPRLLLHKIDYIMPKTIISSQDIALIENQMNILLSDNYPESKFYCDYLQDTLNLYQNNYRNVSFLDDDIQKIQKEYLLQSISLVKENEIIKHKVKGIINFSDIYLKYERQNTAKLSRIVSLDENSCERLLYLDNVFNKNKELIKELRIE